MSDCNDRTRIENARAKLRMISSGSNPGSVVDALRAVIPVAAGFVDTFVESQPEAAVMCPGGMPAGLVEEMMLTRAQDCRTAYSLLLAAPIGQLVLDHEATGAFDWTQIAGYVALERWSLHSPSGIRLRCVGHGQNREHTYLALIREQGDRAWSERERACVHALANDVTEAVERARLPLIAGERILRQVVHAGSFGMVVVNPSGTIRESNHLAHAFARRYGPLAGVLPGKSMLLDLVSRCLSAQRPPHPWTIADSDRCVELELSVHTLGAREHELPEDALLILMKERATPRPARSALPALPPRLEQVARHLSESGQSYKQIADTMHIRLGTFRKHAEHLYRLVGVNSRAELSARWRGSR